MCGNSPLTTAFPPTTNGWTIGIQLSMTIAKGIISGSTGLAYEYSYVRLVYILQSKTINKVRSI